MSLLIPNRQQFALLLRENLCHVARPLMIEANSCAKMGYDLSIAYWGKGLMSETLRAIIAYGFDELGLQKIEADTLSDNSRSVNLLERFGFQLDEVREKSHFFSLRSQNE